MSDSTPEQSTHTEVESSEHDEVNLTRETPLRYAAYLARLKLFAVKAVGTKVRYMAYSSDFGESLRPVLSQRIVKLAYGVAGTYVVGDAAYNAYLDYKQGLPDWVVARTATQAVVFQGIASLAIPTAVIHTSVHQSQRIFQRIGRFTRFGPSMVGLAIIPFLPLVDHPVESLVEFAFDRAIPLPDEIRAKKAHSASPQH